MACVLPGDVGAVPALRQRAQTVQRLAVEARPVFQHRIGFPAKPDRRLGVGPQGIAGAAPVIAVKHVKVRKMIDEILQGVPDIAHQAG